MGRAQGTDRGAIDCGFDAVLGARRGSPQAQAARNAAEACAARRTREEFCATLFAASASESFARTLLDAYDNGLCEPSHPEYAELVAAVKNRCDAFSARETLAAAVHGDPSGLPGITAPLQAGLAAYLADAPAMNDAIAALGAILPGHPELARFERAGDICAAFGALIARSPVDGDALCERAARIMFRAPGAALAGPLRSWVAGFEERMRNGNCLAGERESLRATITTEVLRDDQLAEDFAVLARLLREHQ